MEVQWKRKSEGVPSPPQKKVSSGTMTAAAFRPGTVPKVGSATSEFPLGNVKPAVVKQISARERILCRKRMVDLGCKVIFGRDGLSREGEYSCVSRSSNTRRKRAKQSSVWQWIESLQKPRNLRIHWNCCRRTAIRRGAEKPIPGRL